ncbi:DASH complex subunit dam1 [Microbotryomycetes sp. JL201]|nr:DASH complex subunit dam1 [Microbotryomycetes sp. JL201]
MTTDVDAGPAPASRPRSSSLSRSRPTTPLRRISASSLRSLSLSHSRSRATQSTHEPPLQHLSQLFAELADSMSDLTVKLEDLAQINNDLDGFNQAFASYLYGLRINAYTADFLEASRHSLRSLQPPSPQFAPVHDDMHHQNQDSSPPGSPSASMAPNMTMDSEHSFAPAMLPTSRGGGNVGARGRGRGRGGKAGTVMTKKMKDELAAFSDSIVQLMPIKFREDPERRAEVEKVVSVLRRNPGGLCMSDFGNEVRLPTHRINDSLTALVRAKVVLKIFAGGITTYRFDPTRVSPPTF